ncbi:MAG: aminopeptidase N, partial [Methylobacteriaceae bacterium]|nr:aminopeptidase N [Methylobacteriaceae bacterium]
GYLFAIVGGPLARRQSRFTTRSGRPVEIAVWVEPGKETRADYALDALARSMRWDEEAFGREYDLDVFNVVAVSDFNMGAMENKGLNIFNDKYVLASPETATDTDYANIEAVIAHEYFHNWTGNRITCRDWFQLCLKEGLTVYRDQEFSSDERSRPVQRIGDVRTLRARQFAEDAGPLAHPVRPTEYREINNFYTATVYEKGAELVRMLKTLLGPQVFADGMTRYFDRFDGTAATVEDFLSAFAEVSGRDLGAFARWYAQAGTPTVVVETTYDPEGRRYRLDVAQATPATPGQAEKEPVVIPILLGFVGGGGEPLALRHERLREDGLFVLDRRTDSMLFENVPARPVPSLLRGFSAPVKLQLDLSDDDLLTLLRHDSDPFNRWQAAQTVALRLLVRASVEAAGEPSAPDALAASLGGFLDEVGEADPAFAALTLALPSEAEIAQEIGRDVDPDAVFRARRRLRASIGSALAPRLLSLRKRFAATGPYSPDAESAGQRSLRNVALDLLAAGDAAHGARLARAQFDAATNMTDRLVALAVLSLVSGPERETALASFAERHSGEPLVLDKWFALQATIPEDGTLERVRRLMSHPAFAFQNPNRVRALIGSFAMGNQTQFHRPDGAGYALLAETVLALNAANPQVAARLLTAFGTWRSIEPGRRARAEDSLRRIAAAPNLSPDVADIVGRSLAAS